MLLPGFDNEHAVLDAGVFFALTRVILRLVIADETCFVIPFGRVGQPWLIKIVRPNKLPLTGRSRKAEEQQAEGKVNSHKSSHESSNQKASPATIVFDSFSETFSSACWNRKHFDCLLRLRRPKPTAE